MGCPCGACSSRSRNRPKSGPTNHVIPCKAKKTRLNVPVYCWNVQKGVRNLPGRNRPAGTGGEGSLRRRLSSTSHPSRGVTWEGTAFAVQINDLGVNAAHPPAVGPSLRAAYFELVCGVGWALPGLPWRPSPARSVTFSLPRDSGPPRKRAVSSLPAFRLQWLHLQKQSSGLRASTQILVYQESTIPSYCIYHWIQGNLQ